MALKNVIIMPDFSPYATIKASIIPDRLFADVFHLNEASRNAFEKLTEFKCFVKIDGKPCKVDKKFPSVAFLKKHLKEDHNRYVWYPSLNPAKFACKKRPAFYNSKSSTLSKP